MLSAQSVFDQVARHLLAQGAPSDVKIGAGRRCLLRTKDGRACAIGCLFGDTYRPEFEGVPLSEYMRSSAGAALASQGVDPVEHLDLLQDLMHVHDDFRPVAWPAALETVARAHGLAYELTA